MRSCWEGMAVRADYWPNLLHISLKALLEHESEETFKMMISSLLFTYQVPILPYKEKILPYLYEVLGNLWRSKKKNNKDGMPCKSILRRSIKHKTWLFRQCTILSTCYQTSKGSPLERLTQSTFYVCKWTSRCSGNSVPGTDGCRIRKRVFIVSGSEKLNQSFRTNCIMIFFHVSPGVCPP